MAEGSQQGLSTPFTSNACVTSQGTLFRDSLARCECWSDKRLTKPAAKRWEKTLMMFASFRNPDEVLPVGVPRLLLSESDFHDPDRNDGGEWWQVQPVYALRQGPDAKGRAVHFEVFTKMLGSICSCARMKDALEVSS